MIHILLRKKDLYTLQCHIRGTLVENIVTFACTMFSVHVCCLFVCLFCSHNLRETSTLAKIVCVTRLSDPNMVEIDI
jgi:hypothetical protein